MLILREDRAADAIAILRLNRPEARNALNPEMRQMLVQELEAIEADVRIRATVITGDRNAFAAGADVALLASAGPADLHHLGLPRLWARIFRHRKPLIAAVNGFAYGAGFELALLCDMIIAGPSSRFALPEVKLGIMPGAGGTQRLLRLAGRPRTMGMILDGEPIDGETADRWGLLTELVPEDDGVLPRAIARAMAVAAMPPLAVELMKQAVIEGADLPLDAALLIEQRNMQILFDTPDQKQRMADFLARRQPSAARSGEERK
jgi:enoyl-CoA hydratase